MSNLKLFPLAPCVEHSISAPDSSGTDEARFSAKARQCPTPGPGSHPFFVTKLRGEGRAAHIKVVLAGVTLRERKIGLFVVLGHSVVDKGGCIFLVRQWFVVLLWGARGTLDTGRTPLEEPFWADRDGKIWETRPKPIGGTIICLLCPRASFGAPSSRNEADKKDEQSKRGRHASNDAGKGRGTHGNMIRKIPLTAIRPEATIKLLSREVTSTDATLLC